MEAGGSGDPRRVRRCECDIEYSPPGDVPVIDNVRPLDRKPFARSVTKFMKVSNALAGVRGTIAGARKREGRARGGGNVR